MKQHTAVSKEKLFGLTHCCQHRNDSEEEEAVREFGDSAKLDHVLKMVAFCSPPNASNSPITVFKYDAPRLTGVICFLHLKSTLQMCLLS